MRCIVIGSSHHGLIAAKLLERLSELEFVVALDSIPVRSRDTFDITARPEFDIFDCAPGVLLSTILPAYGADDCSSGYSSARKPPRQRRWERRGGKDPPVSSHRR